MEQSVFIISHMNSEIYSMTQVRSLFYYSFQVHRILGFQAMENAQFIAQLIWSSESLMWNVLDNKKKLLFFVTQLMEVDWDGRSPE